MRHTAIFAACVVFGLALRLAAIQLPGSEDTPLWKLWSFAASDDTLGVYGIGGDPPERRVVKWNGAEDAINYPPIAIYEFALVGHAYRAFRPGFPDSALLLALIKTPILMADAALAWLLFWGVARAGGSRDQARWAALAWWLNPAAVMLGPVLTYFDPLFMLPAVAAVAVASLGRPGWAALWLAVAVWTKPQGLYAAPAVALAVWHTTARQGLARAAIVGTAASVAIVLPYALTGALPNMWLAFGSFWTRRDTLSAQAVNVWWIVNYLLRARFAVADEGWWQALTMIVPRPLAISRFQELGFPNPRPLAAAATLAAVAWAVCKSRRDAHLAMYAALAAFTVHAAFVINVGAHENHQALEVPFLVLAAALRRELRPVLGVVSMICALNLNMFYGLSHGLGWAVPRSISLVDLSIVVAIVNVATFFWFARRLERLSRGVS